MEIWERLVAGNARWILARKSGKRKSYPRITIKKGGVRKAQQEE